MSLFKKKGKKDPKKDPEIKELPKIKLFGNSIVSPIIKLTLLLLGLFWITRKSTKRKKMLTDAVKNNFLIRKYIFEINLP